MFIQTSEGLLTYPEIIWICPYISTEAIDYELEEQPIRLCRKITTVSGNVFVVNSKQRLRTIDKNDYEYKTGLELKVGDNLAVSLGGHPTELRYVELETLEGTSEPKSLTPELARFVGWYLRRRNLFRDTEVHDGNELYAQFFHKDTPNVFDDAEMKEWIYLNILKNDTLSLSIRSSRMSVIIAFLNGFSGYIQTDEKIVIEEPVNFYVSLLALCRSVGVNCVPYNIPVKHWNGLILDEIITIEGVEYDSYLLKTKSFYKLNGVISK